MVDSNIPARLSEIEKTTISSSAVDFEDETGLNPFELYADEVDIYRPDVYRSISKSKVSQVGLILKKAHDAYTLNQAGEPIFPKDVTRAAVYFVRNPLDICISYANHGAADIEKTIKFILNEKASIAGKKSGQLRQLLMSWTSHVQSWINQDDIPIHIVLYEDMLKDTLTTFKTIIRFLGLEYDAERFKKALANSDFKLLQQMEKENGFAEKPQLCKNFFWKGQTGYYREFMNEGQIKKIVDYNYDTMQHYGYIDKYGNLTV